MGGNAPFSPASEGRELQYAGVGCPVDKWGPWFADEDRRHGTLEDVEHNYISLITQNVCLTSIAIIQYLRVLRVVGR